MLQLQFKNDINQFLMEFENWNVYVIVARIAFRKLVRDQWRDQVLWHILMHQEYADDRYCIETVRHVVCDEEYFQEGKMRKNNNFLG